MIVRFFIVSFMAFTLFATNAGPVQQKFDKKAFYVVMASNSISLIDNTLSDVKDLATSQRGAYEGALMMKKAGLVANSKNKLNLFKAGRYKLETLLAKDTTNTEWRFLRLMIQENAPRILNYRRELDMDSQFIVKFYKSLSPDVQQAVIDYSKKSKILNPPLLK